MRKEPEPAMQQPPEAETAFLESGHYEYSYHPSEEVNTPLQIFSSEDMGSMYYTPQEALDLLDFLTPRRSELEQLAQKQAEAAAQPQTLPPLQERINNLFE